MILPNSLGDSRGELGLYPLPLERRGFSVPDGGHRGGDFLSHSSQLHESGQGSAGRVGSTCLPVVPAALPNLSQSYCEPLLTLTGGVRGWPGLAEPQGVPSPAPSLIRLIPCSHHPPSSRQPLSHIHSCHSALRRPRGPSDVRCLRDTFSSLSDRWGGGKAQALALRGGWGGLTRCWKNPVNKVYYL